MDTHTFFLIMRNEMKLQMRSWVFRFFIVLSLVGIVAYQMYIHGAGSSAWKMVALPCSMPLMNAIAFPDSYYVRVSATSDTVGIA